MLLRNVGGPFSAFRPSVSGQALRRFTHQSRSDEAIYVLGIGNLGKYVAHSLMKQASVPVTLLFHRPSLASQWQSAGSAIQCITDGVVDKTSGFGVEVLSPPSSPASPNAPTIKYLILATKTYMTAAALELVKARLNSASSVLFLQNGMGRPNLIF